MSTEQRDQQSPNLITGTQSANSCGDNEHTSDRNKFVSRHNRWVRIGLAAQDKQLKFSNLLTHVNAVTLLEAYKAIEGTKALGVDGISKSEYGKNLQENLIALANRVQRGTYRPQPKREVLIPKANGKYRPIAIACFEDKLVDWVIGKILTQIYEPLFIRNSFGYRPNKSADQAIKACYYSLYKNMRKHVVEIDFSSFFNTIPHRKLMRVMGKRVADRRFKGLIGRFMKGGLISKEGMTFQSKIGTPQGSAMSPILANIYLNEVIDQWFIENYASYYNVIVRYADDAIFFFREGKDAVKFLNDLKLRVERYKLKLNEDKSRILMINKENHKDFNFLGFTFYWGLQGSRRTLKIKTQKEKLHKAIMEFTIWIKSVRSCKKLKEIWKLARSKIRGHINYFGYWMNVPKINHFYQEIIKALFKWLNRRSQKRSYTQEGFHERLKHFPLMEPVGKLKLKQLGWNPYA